MSDAFSRRSFLRTLAALGAALLPARLRAAAAPPSPPESLPPPVSAITTFCYDPSPPVPCLYVTTSVYDAQGRLLAIHDGPPAPNDAI